jgi:murein DD-endopeptidase MepM/ murein hydrolase activator NlpD
MIVMPLRQMNLRTQGLSSSYAASFGLVRNGGKRAHQGWDLEAAIGAQCYAISEGVITHTGFHRQFGLNVVLMFSESGRSQVSAVDALWAFYAHLSHIFVVKDQSVEAGDPIGLTGVTGNADSKAPHLHFEIRSTANPNPGTGFIGRLDPARVLGYRYLVCRPPTDHGVTLRQR